MADSILKFIHDELSKALEDKPPKIPKKIHDLGTLPSDLQNLQFSTDDWAKLSELIEKLNGLGDPDLGGSLIFRILELHFPRIAGVLLLLGAVRPVFSGDEIIKHHIEWASVFQLVSDPRQLLTYWREKILSTSDAQLLQVYLPTLAYAPNSFLEMDHGNLGFSSLSATDNPTRELREELKVLIASLVSSPTPLALPTDADNPIVLHVPPLAADTFLMLVKRARDNPVDEFWQTLVEPAANADDDFPNLSIKTQLHWKADSTFEGGNHWRLTIKSLAPTGTKLEMSWLDRRWHVATGAADENPELITFEAGRANVDSLALGDSAGLLLEVSLPRVFFTVRRPVADQERLFSVGVSLDRVNLTLKPPGMKLLGGIDAFQATTGLDLEYVQGEGLRAKADGGSPSINFAVPINRTIGSDAAGLTISTLNTRVEFALDGEGSEVKGILFRVAMTFDAKGKLGPVEIVASGLGAWFGKWQGARYVDLVYPTGIGASLNTPPISGGGFLQMEHVNNSTRIGGGLALKLTTIGIGALGLLEEGPDGTSFVFILGIRFTPGIQLSFGFELSGVGGLVGLNRRSDNDKLRERLTSGAAGNVLFCSDPVRDGPTLLGYLGELFPASRGSFLIGPTLQVSWISPIIRLNLGVLIELPGPRSIVVLGSLQALIGTEDVALVNLRLDFLGVIDLVKQQITFDASLVNSTILGVLRITGDAAFRLCYGDSPDVVLSIGGFHPRFNAESLQLRPLARVGTSLAIDASVVNIWLRQEAYFAFTSNTLQLGGRTEVGLEIGPMSAHGFLSLDALVQFKPFYFDIAFAAGFDISVEGVDFCGVNVNGRITGPGPIVITASASVKLLFVRISHTESFRLGQNHPDPSVRIDKLSHYFRDQAVKDPSSLHASGNDPQVHTVADSRAGAEAAGQKRLTLLCPTGRLTWTQTVAPLELTITRLRGQPLEFPKQITVTSTAAASDVNEWFGSGQFMELNESQQLANPGMFSHKAGMSLGIATEPSQERVDANPDEVNVIRLPRRRALTATLFLRLSSTQTETLADRLSASRAVTGSPGVTLKEERWQVVSARTGDSEGDLSAMESFQRTRLAPLGSKIDDEEMFCIPMTTKSRDLTNV